MIIEYEDNRLRRPKTVIKATALKLGTYRLETDYNRQLRINVVQCEHSPDMVYINLPKGMKLEVNRG